MTVTWVNGGSCERQGRDERRHRALHLRAVRWIVFVRLLRSDRVPIRTTRAASSRPRGGGDVQCSSTSPGNQSPVFSTSVSTAGVVDRRAMVMRSWRVTSMICGGATIMTAAGRAVSRWHDPRVRRRHHWLGRSASPPAIDETDDLARGGRGAGARERFGDVIVTRSLADALETPFDVLVEYTSAETAKGHAIVAARAGRHVVIGSSGLTTADYDEIDAVAREHGVGVVAVGNFAMTAALLQRFAVEAAAYLPSWEIIDGLGRKRDAPSGMAGSWPGVCHRSDLPRPSPRGRDGRAVDARSADIDGSRIHSVRLPGYTIGLEVRFGQADERLTISYDAGPGAGPYIAGTLLAIAGGFGDGSCAVSTGSSERR